MMMMMMTAPAIAGAYRSVDCLRAAARLPLRCRRNEKMRYPTSCEQAGGLVVLCGIRFNARKPVDRLPYDDDELDAASCEQVSSFCAGSFSMQGSLWIVDRLVAPERQHCYPGRRR